MAVIDRPVTNPAEVEMPAVEIAPVLSAAPETSLEPGFSEVDAEFLRWVDGIIDSPDSRYISLEDGREDFSGLMEPEDRFSPDLNPLESDSADWLEMLGETSLLERLNHKLVKTYVGVDTSILFSQERMRQARARANEAFQDAKVDLENVTNPLERIFVIRQGATEIVDQALLQNRTGEVVRAAGDDIREGDWEEKALKGALTTGMVVTEVLDRMRIMVVAIPHVATEMLTNTHSPVRAAIVAAGLFTAWNLGSSEVLARFLDRFKNAKETFKAEFPEVVGAFRDALPGANKEVAKAKAEELEDAAISRKTLAFTGRQAARGFTGVSLGTTAFVATASANGDTLNEVREEYLKVSAATAAVTAGIVATIGQFMFEAPKHGMAGVSEWMYNRATDMKTWYAFAAASIGLSFYDSWTRKQKDKAEYEAFLEAPVELD